jgi:ribonuclease HI
MEVAACVRAIQQCLLRSDKDDQIHIRIYTDSDYVIHAVNSDRSWQKQQLPLDREYIDRLLRLVSCHQQQQQNHNHNQRISPCDAEIHGGGKGKRSSASPIKNDKRKHRNNEDNKRKTHTASSVASSFSSVSSSNNAFLTDGRLTEGRTYSVTFVHISAHQAVPSNPYLTTLAHWFGNRDADRLANMASTSVSRNNDQALKARLHNLQDQIPPHTTRDTPRRLK